MEELVPSITVLQMNAVLGVGLWQEWHIVKEAPAPLRLPIILLIQGVRKLKFPQESHPERRKTMRPGASQWGLVSSKETSPSADS